MASSIFINLFAVFSPFAAYVLGMDPVYEFALVVKLNCTFAIAAIPEAVVAFQPVRSFIVDEKHVVLLTGDVGNHPAAPGPLVNMPDDLGIGLLAVEPCPAECPELGEVELEAAALVPEGGQELAVEDDRSAFGPASAYVKD